MGNETLSRKGFFKTISGFKKQAADSSEGRLTGEPEDPLFKKYARKSLGNRVYSTRVELPSLNDDSQILNRVGNVTSGIAPYTGAWTVWEVTHLLRRVGFGVKKTDVDALLALTPGTAVDAMLNIAPPTLPSATPLNYYQNTLPDSGGILLGGSWTSNNLTYVNANDDTNNYYRQLSLTSWSWGVCINDATTIREKMTQFWYHFIPVNFDDVRGMQANSATMCNDYMSLLRSNALGNFKTLMKAIAKMPAMLVYLSNQYSTASVPNENFARELLELFTMGKVPTQNYTESDIIAASKVLSGWRLSSFTAAYPFAPGFNASYHNQTNKTFSANFGNTTINNQAGAAGANEFDIFFDMLFTQQASTIAKYVCRRLYRFFVYYDIDANVEANVIVPLSNVLLTNNWDMNITVMTLLKSEHFFDVVNRGVMIKSPVDFLTGIIRTMNVNTIPAAGATQVVNQYAIWNYFQSYALNNLEQGLGLVPNVSGWKAYYQEPTFYQNWINSNAIQRRAAILTSFMNGFTQGTLSIKIDVIAYVQQFPNATIQDPDLLIDAIVQQWFSVDLPANYKSDTKVATLLNGQVTNSYWTTAWNNYIGTPSNTTYLNTVKNRLNSLFTTFLQLAEFQLM
ncbi:MAG: DUF1800 family protein [Ferruginibacter sp.]